MDNPRCIVEEAAAVASSFYEEILQPKAEQKMTAISCPKCGSTGIPPASKFCNMCGYKLQRDKLLTEKGILSCIDFDLINA